MTGADTAVRVAMDLEHVLAEGPFWDSPRDQLLWVDIKRGLVCVGRLAPDDTIRVVRTVEFPETVGAVATSRSGEWLVAGGRDVLACTSSGDVRARVTVVSDGVRSRLNDGKPDPAGRFLVGTLALDEHRSTEVLASVDVDRSVRVLDDDLSLSNGLAWSPDGSVMYSVDSYHRRVLARPYEPSTGEVGPRRTAITMDSGYPDGMCTDVDGALWIAMWGLGQVRRYAPDGELLSTIDVPAPHVSSVAFAGADLEVLVITTATSDLTAEQRRSAPLSGRLFTTRPGVAGCPVALWSGLAGTD